MERQKENSPNMWQLNNTLYFFLKIYSFIREREKESK